MASILELAAEILSAHAANNQMTTDQLIDELRKIHATLKNLESGEVIAAIKEEKPPVSGLQSIKRNEVICLICNKGGFKTLTKHLNSAHGIKPREYKKQFGIPSTQSLSAKSLTEARKKLATERNLAGNLEKARVAKAATRHAAKPTKTRAPKKK